MSAIKVTILDAGTGTCSLTGKECDGLQVTFEDGTVRESFLSWKAFRQLLGMKAGQSKPVRTDNVGIGPPGPERKSTSESVAAMK